MMKVCFVIVAAFILSCYSTSMAMNVGEDFSCPYVKVRVCN